MFIKFNNRTVEIMSDIQANKIAPSRKICDEIRMIIRTD